MTMTPIITGTNTITMIMTTGTTITGMNLNIIMSLGRRGRR